MMKISDSELELMKLLWEHAPRTTPELIEECQKRFQWEESTVKTLLSRLLQKAAIERQGEKRSYSYLPLIKIDDYKHRALKSFVAKLFNADPMEMLCFFAKNENISAEEFKELEKIIKEAKK